MSEIRSQTSGGQLQLRPHTLMLQKGTLPLPRQDEISWVTTPIDEGALADNFFRVSVGNPQRETPESPILGAG